MRPGQPFVVAQDAPEDGGSELFSGDLGAFKKADRVLDARGPILGPLPLLELVAARRSEAVGNPAGTQISDQGPEGGLIGLMVAHVKSVRILVCVQAATEDVKL